MRLAIERLCSVLDLDNPEAEGRLRNICAGGL